MPALPCSRQGTSSLRVIHEWHDTPLRLRNVYRFRSTALAGNPLGMAVRTLDEVNIVTACRSEKRRVHLLHIQAAIGQAWMAVGARGARLLAMLQMARQ